MTNETKIVITGNTVSAEDALQTLGSKLDSTTRKMFDLSGMAGTLGGMLTITAFVGFIKSAIDAQDQLSHLAEITGTAVEELAGLKFAAEQNDASLESVANAAKKLATNLSEHPDLFRKYGITAKDTTGALVQLADIFKTMPDGVEKTALAVKLMGRSGEEMIPILNNGSAALREQIRLGKELNPATAESAAQAREFNDQLNLLSAQAGTFGIQVSSSLLPAMNSSIKMATLAQKEYGSLVGILALVGNAALSVFGVEVDPQKRAQNEINDIFKERLGLWKDLKIQESRLGSPAFNQEYVRKDIIATENALKKLEDRLQRIKDKAPAITGEPAQKAGKGQGADMLGDLTGTSTDKNAAALAQMEAEAYRKYAEALGFTSEQIKVFEFSQTGATAAQILSAQAAADSITLSNLQIKTEKDKAKAIEEAGKMGEKQAEKQRELNLTLMNELAAKNELQSQNMLANLEGDPRVEAERAIARAQEEARFQVKDRAIQNEIEKMRADGLLTEEIAQQQMQRREILEEDHQSRLTLIDNRYLTQRQQFERMSTSAQISTIGGMVAAATAAGASRNRALFEINKIASIASATVSTYEGATKALGQLGAWGPPVAATIIAGGLANVAMIAGTQFGGGMPSGGGAGSGIPSLATNLPAVNSGTPPSSSSNAPTPVNVSIYNTGNVMTQDFVDGTLIPQIKDRIANSDVLIIDPRSRQAQVLSGV